MCTGNLHKDVYNSVILQGSVLERYLVDDVDSVLQHESCSLPLVVRVGVFDKLLDLFFSRLTEQDLNTI